MDKREDSKEASEDLIRESLIEISNCLPDKVQEPDVREDVVIVAAADGDEAEKYRSELISISYSESSDLTSSLAAVGKPRG